MYTIKSITITAAFIALSFLSFSQQESKIWLRIAEPSNVPFENTSGTLISNDADLNDAISALGITKVQRAVPASRLASLLNVYELTSETSATAEMYALLINSVSVVSDVEYAPKYESLALPNDYNATFSNDYALDLISASGAWDLTTGNSDIVLAISDQNYFIDHEEIQGKQVHYDASNTSSKTHGTAVAIAAAGASNNGVGKSSIGFNSSLALYKMSYNEVLEASYAGHKVVNLSWTSGCSYNQYLQDIMNEVYNNGTFIVAAAGNGSTCGGAENLVYPAAFDNVFAVTSIGPNDNHERTIGDPLSTHQHNVSVDLSAPGYNVAISGAPGWYLFGTGSSYATPMVTGTIGLMLDVNPCLSNAEIAMILRTSSTPIDAINPNYAGTIGAGRLNAQAAVEMAEEVKKVFFDITSSVSCIENSGQIDVNIIGGTPPFTSVWSNGSTDLNLNNLNAGHYTLTVTDVVGCTKDTTVTIEDVTPTVFEGAIQHVNCNGNASGAIDVTILEGTPDFIFEWDNGMTTEDISGLVAGTYRLKITNGNGCSVWDSYTVEQANLIEASIETEQPTDVIDGSIDLTVTGGTAPYSFTWSNGEVTEDLFNLASGFYEVTAMDANGCDVIIGATVEEPILANIESIENIGMNIYPNPSSGVATILWDKESVNTITILDAGGKLVGATDVSMQKSYKISDLNSGIYFINLIEQDNFKTTKKLVVR
jgi:hypothetical protein